MIAEEERAQSSSDGDESGDLDTECGLGEKNFKRNAHTPAINKSLTKYVEICYRMIQDFDCERCGHLEGQNKFSPSVLEFSVLTRFVSSQERNGYTNHCSQCLWSKHVDINPGDRSPELLQPSVDSNQPQPQARGMPRDDGAGRRRE